MNFSDIIATGSNTFVKKEYLTILGFLFFFAVFISVQAFKVYFLVLLTRTEVIVHFVWQPPIQYKIHFLVLQMRN